MSEEGPAGEKIGVLLERAGEGKKYPDHVSVLEKRVSSCPEIGYCLVNIDSNQAAS